MGAPSSRWHGEDSPLPRGCGLPTPGSLPSGLKAQGCSACGGQHRLQGGCRQSGETENRPVPWNGAHGRQRCWTEMLVPEAPTQGPRHTTSPRARVTEREEPGAAGRRTEAWRLAEGPPRHARLRVKRLMKISRGTRNSKKGMGPRRWQRARTCLAGEGGCCAPPTLRELGAGLFLPLPLSSLPRCQPPPSQPPPSLHTAPFPKHLALGPRP